MKLVQEGCASFLAQHRSLTCLCLAEDGDRFPAVLQLLAAVGVVEVAEHVELCPGICAGAKPAEAAASKLLEMASSMNTNSASDLRSASKGEGFCLSYRPQLCFHNICKCY